VGIIRKINTHFIKGSWLEKKLFVKAFFYMLIIRYWMLKVKFSKYEKYLGKRGNEAKKKPTKDNEYIIQTIRKVVKATSKNTPWESKCMVQAMSCKWLLKQQGINSTIYFGVKPDEENKGKLKAHAWLKIGDYIATGREGHKEFKVVNFYS